MVKWSEPAILDLRSIHDFIAHDSRFYARKVILDKADILDELPKIGKKHRNWMLKTSENCPCIPTGSFMKSDRKESSCWL